MGRSEEPSRRRPITMRDVAELAKVSQSTVSRVLNGADSTIPIGEQTRRRVLDAVDELGYQPNLHAGSLRGQKTRMIAMMIADIGNPHYHPMVRVAQDIAALHKYDVMIASSDHLLEREQHFVESVIRRPVDGIFMVSHHLSNDDLDELMDRTGSALAAIGQHIENPNVDVVFGTDGQATEEAVLWLFAAKGHTRIGFLGVAERFVTDRTSAGPRRSAAYHCAMARAGLNVPSGYVQGGDWSPESGYEAMQRFCVLDEPPSALFVCNDLMAIGAMEAAQNHGLRVPEDIAIVGFDDIPAASWVRPRLTTIAQFPTEMSSLLVNALFERIHGEYSGPGRRFEVPCRLIERDSA